MQYIPSILNNIVSFLQLHCSFSELHSIVTMSFQQTDKGHVEVGIHSDILESCNLLHENIMAIGPHAILPF